VGQQMGAIRDQENNQLNNKRGNDRQDVN
jgi:hypothetical protein